MRHHAEQLQSFPFQAAAGEFGDIINFFPQHFVEDDADDLDAFFFKQRLVEGDLVDGFADAALGDNDDFGGQQFGDARIGQVEHRADAGVARTLTKHEILFPGNAVEGVLDALHQRVVIR